MVVKEELEMTSMANVVVTIATTAGSPVLSSRRQTPSPAATQQRGIQSTPFKKRHSNPKQEVKKRLVCLDQHHGGTRACCYQDMSIVLIEQVEMGNMTLLACLLVLAEPIAGICEERRECTMY